MLCYLYVSGAIKFQRDGRGILDYPHRVMYQLRIWGP
jgi:hypothetical protein